MMLKPWLFRFATVVIGLWVVEFFALVAMMVVTGKMLPQARLKSEMLSNSLEKDAKASGPVREIRGEIGWNEGRYREVIHPFLGYVVDPEKTPGISEYGFPGASNPILSRSDDAIIVGVLGGSFAHGMFASAADTLKTNLAFPGKTVTVINLAMGGYKQPQQLLTLVYFLSLGAQFDIVINVDGFNEMVLTAAENIPNKVCPVFPRAWAFRVADIKDPDLLKTLGGLSNAENRRKRLASFFLENHLYLSATMGALWKGIDSLLEDEERRLRFYAKGYEKHVNRSYMANGPAFKAASPDDPHESLARFWGRCSLQLSLLCEANGIKYYHFLQPNQYVHGSKPMNADEKAVACNEKSNYGLCVGQGYPFLRKHAKRLAEQGVIVTDLTMMFAECQDPLYIDDCCHLNDKGYKMVAETVSTVILEDRLRRLKRTNTHGPRGNDEHRILRSTELRGHSLN